MSALRLLSRNGVPLQHGSVELRVGEVIVALHVFGPISSISVARASTPLKAKQRWADCSPQSIREALKYAESLDRGVAT